MTGVHLYKRRGYREVDRGYKEVDRIGVRVANGELVPVVRMVKK